MIFRDRKNSRTGTAQTGIEKFFSFHLHRGCRTLLDDEFPCNAADVVGRLCDSGCVLRLASDPGGISETEKSTQKQYVAIDLYYDRCDSVGLCDGLDRLVCRFRNSARRSYEWRDDADSGKSVQNGGSVNIFLSDAVRSSRNRSGDFVADGNCPHYLAVRDLRGLSVLYLDRACFFPRKILCGKCRKNSGYEGKR